MLDKILNINPELNFKGKEQKSSQRNLLKKNYDSSNHFGDSINISPSLMYLTALGWHLKELKNTHNEKVFISFLLSDFEFQSEIDIFNLQKFKQIFLKVIQEKIDNTTTLKTQVDFAVDVNNLNLDSKIYFIELNALALLFSKILKYGSDFHLSSVETSTLNHLTDDLFDELNFELTIISNSILFFVEKLKDINFNLSSNNSKETNLKILSVNTIKAEDKI